MLIAPKIVFADNPKDNTGEINLVRCACCGCWHPEDFNGDCRDDDNRLHPDDLQEFMPNVNVMDMGSSVK